MRHLLPLFLLGLLLLWPKVVPAQERMARSPAPITNPNLALGLVDINDWSPQLPFLDQMKSARRWTGHLPNQFGGWGEAELQAAGALDDQGWPRFIPPELDAISALILVDLPSDAAGAAGRYVLRHDGKGRIKLMGRAEAPSYGRQEARFSFRPGPGIVDIKILETDPQDPIRNITVVREDRLALFDAGQIFNPDLIALLKGVKTLRFMTWMKANYSQISHLDHRPKRDDYTYARRGAPIEVMVELANILGSNPWFTLPHQADDDFIRFYADYTHRHLDPRLVAHVELSNEVWNWQFEQAAWANQQAIARWGKENRWLEYYALRASQMADIWSETYGADAPERLVRIISSQTGWLGLEELVFDGENIRAEGLPPPATHFDAYAVTGYFSGSLGSEEMLPTLKSWLRASAQAAEASARDKGLSGPAARIHIDRHRYDLVFPLAYQEVLDARHSGKQDSSTLWLIENILPYHAKVAQRWGLKLVMYEGGTHVVSLGKGLDDPEITAFFNAFNYTEGMAQLYQRVMKAWATLTPEPFMAFVDVEAPSKWGSWGALRHLGDDNPRWRILAGGCAGC